MQYTVTFEVISHYTATVDAENIEEAKELAEHEFTEADFGVSENIEGEINKVYDENDEEVYTL